MKCVRVQCIVLTLLLVLGIGASCQNAPENEEVSVGVEQEPVAEEVATQVEVEQEDEAPAESEEVDADSVNQEEQVEVGTTVEEESDPPETVVEEEVVHSEGETTDAEAAQETNQEEQESEASTAVAVIAETEKTSSNKKQSSKKGSSQKQEKQEQVQEIAVSLVVSSPSGTVQYDIQAEHGDSVETVMKRAKQSGLSYATRAFSGLGAYIEAINGLEESGTSGMYWIYYVNGVKAMAGVSNTTVKDGDTITWKYEKSF